MCVAVVVVVVVRGCDLDDEIQQTFTDIWQPSRYMRVSQPLTVYRGVLRHALHCLWGLGLHVVPPREGLLLELSPGLLNSDNFR